MGLGACTVLMAVGLALGLLVLPRYHPRLFARTTAFRHGEPWVASACWAGGLVVMYLALGSYWQQLPVPVQKLAAPVLAPAPVAAAPTAKPTATTGAAKTPAKKPVTTQKPPAPAPAPAPSPSPAPSPIPSPLGVKITDATYGKIAATTERSAVCTASVALPNGQTINKSTPKTASVSGKVSWVYATQPGLTGTATAKVTCSLNGRTGSATKTFTITAVSPSPLSTPTG